MTLKQRTIGVIRGVLIDHARFLVALLYGDIWCLRLRCLKSKHGFRHVLYYCYFEACSSWIGTGTRFADIPIFPHGLRGVFISTHAEIGRNCTIYQNVTIGSNGGGAPIIGNDVLIGAGAVVIGPIKIGDGVKIGAGATVAKDVLQGQTVVACPMRVISHG